MSHNLDQCLAELNADVQKREQERLTAISKAAVNVMYALVFKLTPVKTGITAATTDLMINGVSGFKITRTKARKAVGYRNKFVPERQRRIAEAKKRIDAVKHISELHQITISNNAPTIRYIGEQMNAVFAQARQKAQMELDKLQAEVS